MCYIDLEPCRVWVEKERTARKAHRCSSCGGPIAPGTRYTSHFSVGDGSPNSQAICPLCFVARDEFAEEHDGMRPTPSYFPELLNECIANGDEESEKKWKPMLVALQARASAASDPKGPSSPPDPSTEIR